MTEIPEYTSARAGELGPDDEFPFKMDGELYALMRPKVSIAMAMMTLAESGEDRDVLALGMDLARLIAQILAYVKAEAPTVAEDGTAVLHGRARLEQRLADPMDGFDVTDLAEVFGDLTKQMFARPTGARPELSTKPPAMGSQGSGAGTRSTRARKSGTSKQRSSSLSAMTG